MDAKGRHQRQLPVPQHQGAEPDWSSDGHTIVFRMSSSTGEGFCLWTINVQSGQLSQLTTTNTVSDLSPAWSPDGTRIAFARDMKIWTIRMRDHHLTELTDGIDATPVWSPDSRRIAFWHRGSLWVMNADGSHAHRAVTGRHRAAGGALAGFTWSADGKWVIFTVDRRGDLLAKHLNGSGLHVIRHDSGGPNGWHDMEPDG